MSRGRCRGQETKTETKRQKSGAMVPSLLGDGWGRGGLHRQELARVGL